MPRLTIIYVPGSELPWRVDTAYGLRAAATTLAGCYRMLGKARAS